MKPTGGTSGSSKNRGTVSATSPRTSVVRRPSRDRSRALVHREVAGLPLVGVVAMVADERREARRPVVEPVDPDRDAELLLDRRGLALEDQQPVAPRDPELDHRDLADALPQRPPGRIVHADQVRRAIRDVPQGARRRRDRQVASRGRARRAGTAAPSPTSSTVRPVRSSRSSVPRPIRPGSFRPSRRDIPPLFIIRSSETFNPRPWTDCRWLWPAPSPPPRTCHRP